MRVPGIFWWPGKLKSGIVTDIGSTLDLFATASSLAHVELPQGRIIDGVDLSSVLFGLGNSERDNMIYYRGQKIYAARKGAYKLHYITQTAYVKNTKKTTHDPALLFNLDVDPSEKYNIAEEYPEIIKEINKMVELYKAGVIPVKDQLAERSK